MDGNNKKFHTNLEIQYSSLGEDLRFYADQRFKIATVFLITMGFMANLAGNHPSVILGVVGFSLTFLIFSWERRTSQWHAILFEGFKEIEAIAESDNTMLNIYQSYPSKPMPPFVSATRAIESIYTIGLICWLLFIIDSWPILW